jgi:hypothetical protein
MKKGCPTNRGASAPFAGAKVPTGLGDPDRARTGDTTTRPCGRGVRVAAIADGQASGRGRCRRRNLDEPPFGDMQVHRSSRGRDLHSHSRGCGRSARLRDRSGPDTSSLAAAENMTAPPLMERSVRAASAPSQLVPKASRHRRTNCLLSRGGTSAAHVRELPFSDPSLPGRSLVRIRPRPEDVTQAGLSERRMLSRLGNHACCRRFSECGRRSSDSW